MRRMKPSVLAAAAAAVVLALAATGAATARVSAPNADGTLVVATDATYAPNEFIGTDGQTVSGMDPDLAAALGSALHRKVKVVNATFDAIIPGLASGKYDLGMSARSPTRKRARRSSTSSPTSPPARPST